MKKVLWGLLAGTFIIVASCGDDEPLPTPPSPPEGVFGIIGDMEGPSLDMIILWVANNETDLAGYNVYRKIGGNGTVLPPEPVYEKLNTTAIVEDTVMGCYFVDADFDETSPTTHYYYVTGLDRSGNESQPSCTLSCIPNAFNSSNEIEILSPLDGSENVSATPTFLWSSKAGASSYCLILQHGAGLENPPLWVFRASDTSFAYGQTTGYTYRLCEYSSLPDSTYRWQVFAIDDKNASFAGSEAYFRTGQ